VAAVKPKWTEQKSAFFTELKTMFSAVENWNAVDLELLFKSKAETENIKPGELMLPFRIMLVGGKFGPQVFEIAELLGKEETLSRISKALSEFNS
jgi:glutamyl-tRNA synthetase